MLSELSSSRQGYALRVWIETGTRAIIIRQDLQRNMRNLGEKIKAQRPSKIEFTKELVEQLAGEIQEMGQGRSKAGNNVVNEAARKAASSIVGIVETTFKSKEDIEHIGNTELLERMASMVYSNPTRHSHEGVGTYSFLCEPKKNECRKLIVTAMEVFANPKKSSLT